MGADTTPDAGRPHPLDVSGAEAAQYDHAAELIRLYTKATPERVFGVEDDRIVFVTKRGEARTAFLTQLEEGWAVGWTVKGWPVA